LQIFSWGGICWAARALKPDNIWPSMDESESTVTDDIFSFGPGGPVGHQQVLTRDDLLARVTALMQSCEGCENVNVIGVTPLDHPDTGGCNWSFTLVLDTAGVAAEVYGYAYAQVIGMARGSWNLA
jgi:hypothetical protein